MWGHSHKLEAIAAHPDDLAFVTAGYDKIVAKWRKQKILWKVNTQSELISVAYHPTQVRTFNSIHFKPSKSIPCPL